MQCFVAAKLGGSTAKLVAKGFRVQGLGQVDWGRGISHL